VSGPLESYDRIRQLVTQRRQEHVFRFWDQLDEDERRHLLEELDSLDFDEVARLAEQHLKNREDEQHVPDIEPPPYIPVPRTDAERRERAEARRLGEETVRRNRVAAFLVAGGQGTRLGYDGPKGCFPIGPVSGKTLFQLFAEKILAARCRYDAAIPWYIMTSRDNDAVTRETFSEHNHFGLPAEDVFFLRQGLMPALDNDGRLLMAGPGRLALSPDGHGGAIRALKRSGALEDMARRGIRHISHFQVDNVLVLPVDPVFIGFHVKTGSQMSSIMVRKRSADERVGHLVVVNGKLTVIEYSDMPRELTEKTGPDGTLLFDAGSVAIHIYDVDFVERLSQQGYELPFHRAWKKVPFVNELSHLIRPRHPNANKFEMFIFDALPAAEKTLVLEAAREECFSPVKNARGEDSVTTGQNDMMRQAARRAREAGADVPADDTGLPEHKLEISPLIETDTEALAERLSRAGPDLLSRDTYVQ